MELTILGPTHSQKFMVNWLEAQTDEGNIVILPGHVPMIIILAPNKDIVMELSDLTKTSFPVSRGILQVTRTALTVLIS